ncbi:hypothetical protein [Undibacterium sp. TC9W]|uniref:hypothetical protein n=1 Tax=Undibacterium sp. TC9W TaxID=3413053 RepID=UPI003BF19483
MTSQAKPALGYTNKINPDGPHYVTFDEVRRASDGSWCMILNLEEQSDIEKRKDRFLLCLEALEQNKDFGCMVLLKENDCPTFHELAQQFESRYLSALQRTQFASE